MALILSTDKPLNTFELAMKSAWANHNDDGVGIYWRDLSGNHLARFKDSKDLAKVPNDYDRMLIHFRKSTKGEGTHPFRCICRPDLHSEQWIMTHNGAVDDSTARASLVKAIEKKGLTAHEFSTNIDSEPFIHIWGELAETDLLERAKVFTAQVNELQLHGWANLIFYNVVTDEYVVFVDTAIRVVQSKKRDITVICSDSAWLDSDASRKLGVTDANMNQGTVIYGKGLKFKTKKNVWVVKPRGYGNQTALPSCEIPKGAVNNGAKGFFSGTESYYSDNKWIEDHYYKESKIPDVDLGEYFCVVCQQSKEFHRFYTKKEMELAENARMKDIETVKPEVWEPKSLEGHILAKPTNVVKEGKNVAKFGSGFVMLRVTNCFCRPQDDANRPSNGICQLHYVKGFRQFFHDQDGYWYLVRRTDYTTGDGTVAYDSGSSGD